MAGQKFTSKEHSNIFHISSLIVFQYDYPLVERNEKRFLNSGGFIGYAWDIYEMITSKEKIEDTEDDQLFYTKIFLDEYMRVS